MAMRIEQTHRNAEQVRRYVERAILAVAPLATLRVRLIARIRARLWHVTTGASARASASRHFLQLEGAVNGRASARDRKTTPLLGVSGQSRAACRRSPKCRARFCRVPSLGAWRAFP